MYIALYAMITAVALLFGGVGLHTLNERSRNRHMGRGLYRRTRDYFGGRQLYSNVQGLSVIRFVKRGKILTVSMLDTEAQILHTINQATEGIVCKSDMQDAKSGEWKPAGDASFIEDMTITDEVIEQVATEHHQAVNHAKLQNMLRMIFSAG